MELNFVETLRSSFTMIVLLGCSVVVLTFIFERWFYLKHTRIDSERFFEKVRDAFHRNGIDAAISICSNSIAPLASVIKSGLEESNKNMKASAEIMDAISMEQRAKLEKNLSVLGTLGNIAPLIGLFGTVVGIIRAFHALALSGSAGPSVISAGIAEALVTTASGLVVAIPAVIFYNYFLRKVGVIMTEIESVSKKTLVMLGYNS
jgi:biopolymer transport protein ExbB